MTGRIQIRHTRDCQQQHNVHFYVMVQHNELTKSILFVFRIVVTVYRYASENFLGQLFILFTAFTGMSRR